MPPRSKSGPPANQTVARRVRVVSAQYRVRVPGANGRMTEVENWGAFGEEIQLDPIEAMRLDSLGALCPPGWTKADAEADRDARIARYRAERSGVGAL
jgi:hypothetical protein